MTLPLHQLLFSFDEQKHKLLTVSTQHDDKEAFIAKQRWRISKRRAFIVFWNIPSNKTLT